MIRPSMIRTATRPFVARALRGRRGRRLGALALMLTLLSGVLGTWLALGTGDVERELRVGFGLEAGRWEQEQRRFVVIADDAEQAEAMRRHLARAQGGWFAMRTGEDAEYRVLDALRSARFAVRDAALSESPRNHRDIQREAQVVWSEWSAMPDPERRWVDYGTSNFAWYDDRAVEGLRAILARGGAPGVEVYASPLPVLDALRFSGVVAGGMLLLLLMLAAPVLAGTQMAQETHENTLQPLAGSALRAEELALGLTSGPLAVAALLAAPQLILMLVAALVTGSPGAGLALVGVAVAGGAFLVVLAQLAGLALGRLRSPGLVGGGLAIVLGILGGIGLALSAEVSWRTAGTLALLPEAAGGHALAQTFGLGERDYGFFAAHDTSWILLLGSVGMLTFATLGMRALARRIGQTAPSALRAREALVAAGVAMALVTCANPMNMHWRAESFFLLNLGVLSVPLAILLMMRAPTGDAPLSMRRASVGRLVLELLGWAALYLGAAVCFVGLDRMDHLFHPVAFAYLLWFLTVGALLSLRVVMAPMTFLSWVWGGVIAMGLGAAFLHVEVWSREFASHRPLFGLGELSPFLGVVQAIMMVVIPWTLVRTLRRGRAIG